MANDLIFRDQNSLPAIINETSDLAKKVNTGINLNRIQTNTNGTFRRFVGGEQIGKAIRGAFNAIIVDFLPKVSRTYYEAAYDPEATPTLPDCWSNMGDVPDESAPNPQALSCAKCPQNIKGSADNGKSRACRFNRRVALMLEGDDSGNVYQLNIPSKSLFGKGNGNVHPFESYVQYLVANKTSPDYVVTTIEYDLEADTMQLMFSPWRAITQDEKELVIEAQCNPDTQRYIQLTVAEASGVTAEPAQSQTQTQTQTPAAPAQQTHKPKPAPQSFTDDGDDDEEETPQPPAPMRQPPQEQPKPKAAIAIEQTQQPVPPKSRRRTARPTEPEAPPAKVNGGISAFDDGDDDDAPAPLPTPTRRRATQPAKPAAPAEKGELTDLISSWMDDDDEAEAAE